MIKIKFENLLVSIVVSVVVFFNTISTTMLDRTFFQVKVNFLFLVVLLLGLRFLYKMRVSYKYLILSILLLLSGVLVYFQTNRLNFLVYSMLLVLLVNVVYESSFEELCSCSWYSRSWSFSFITSWHGS